MKSKCEATCGFCGFKTFEEAEKTRKRMDQLARGQECDTPRKCVFPREKMLNSTKNSLRNLTETTISIDPIIVYKSKFDWRSTTNDYNNTTESSQTTQVFNSTFDNYTTLEPSNTTKIDLKTILQSTGKLSTKIGSTSSTLKPRHARTIEASDQNEKLKTFASKSRNETSITLPSSFNSTVRKLTLEELKTTRDTMPKITTAEPSSLVTSLSKTVIQGTCFDEYTYCREFTSLCSHPAFSEVMASHCSLTCGRCDEVERVEEGSEDCHDMTPDCKNYRDLCDHSRYKTLMENYCPKVCGHCIPMCRDRHQNCPQFFDDGFCNDTMYTHEERKYLCGATCLLC
uniref:ShKT domain-containing protein n=1 Tax=Caenorhabditis tropicalis TaxID=1561998 RepID=A0A1I7TMC1_9PELO